MLITLAQTGQAAVDIIEAGQVAQQAIIEAMDQLWTDVLSGPLYGEMSNLGAIFAVTTLLLLVFRFIRAWLSEDNIDLGELFWVIVVALLLANNGALLRNSTLGLRAIVNNLNEQLLNGLNSGISLQAAYQQVVGNVAAETAIEALIAQCAAITNPAQQQDCYAQAAIQAQQIASGLPSGATSWLQNIVNGIGNILSNPTSIITQPIASVLQTSVRGWLIAFGIAFQWLVEVSLLLTALLGPLAVGGSLLPVGQKSIFTWLIGFFSVGMTKIYFNVITGLVATLVLNAGQNDTLIFAFATGLLAPILALLLSVGGGIAIFNGLTSVGGLILRRFPNFV